MWLYVVYFVFKLYNLPWINSFIPSIANGQKSKYLDAIASVGVHMSASDEHSASRICLHLMNILLVSL